MGHLSSADMIDVIEGVGAPAAVAHAGRCAACRDAVAELRATLRVAAEIDVPAPSPLFWDHFSSRVRDAVADEPRPGFVSQAGHARWSGWTAGRLALVGALAVLLIAVAIDTRSRWGGAPDAPAASSTTLASAASTMGATGQGVTTDDASLDLVADLSQDLDWDQTADAGMMVKVGSVDSAVTQLSAPERVALARLLEAQLNHTSS